jgi:hypothetical protein
MNKEFIKYLFAYNDLNVINDYLNSGKVTLNDIRPNPLEIITSKFQNSYIDHDTYYNTLLLFIKHHVDLNIQYKKSTLLQVNIKDTLIRTLLILI